MSTDVDVSYCNGPASFPCGFDAPAWWRSRGSPWIGEAGTRPTRRVVPITRIEPQDLQALHRVRERLIKARTAWVNAIRGRLYEYGMGLPQGITQCRRLLVERLEAEHAPLTPCRRALCRQRSEAFLALAPRRESYGMQLATIGQAHPACQRWQPMPGLGPVTAIALIGAIGEATPCKNGRQLAAWLVLVPRAHSTGGKPRLLGISTRGEVYLRTLLVPGARTTRRWVETTAADRSRWLKARIARRGKHRAAVA